MLGFSLLSALCLVSDFSFSSTRFCTYTEINVLSLISRDEAPTMIVCSPCATDHWCEVTFQIENSRAVNAIVTRVDSPGASGWVLLNALSCHRLKEIDHVKL